MKIVLDQLILLERFVQERRTFDTAAHKAFGEIFDGYVPPLKDGGFDFVVRMCANSIDQMFYNNLGGTDSSGVYNNLDTIEYFVYEVLFSDKFQGAIRIDGTSYTFRTAEEFLPAIVALNENFYRESKPSVKQDDPELHELKALYAELYHRYATLDSHYQEQIKILLDRIEGLQAQQSTKSRLNSTEEHYAKLNDAWRQMFEEIPFHNYK